VGADVAMAVPIKKKLLVLDVNGLLVETYFQFEKLPEEHRPDGKVGRFFVYRRPFCDEFLEFCFENFVVGIWSSAQQHNVDRLVDFIFGDLKKKLLFSWHQIDCTDTGLKTPENTRKPLFLKELSKLWNKVRPDLPWEEGEYGPCNTLLIDDSPYKALRNPPHTAVFPYPYKVTNELDDILGGDLRKYLEGLLAASNVQQYVEHHQFGQSAISTESPNWHFYRQVLLVNEPIQKHGTAEKLPVSNLTTTRPSKKLQGEHLPCDNLSKSDLATSIDRLSVPGMRIENNSVVKRVVSQKNEAHNISKEDEVALTSDHAHHSESGLNNGPLSSKRKTEDRFQEAKEVDLPSDHVQLSESCLHRDSLLSKRNKTCKSHIDDTSVHPHSYSGMGTEENGAVDTVLSSLAQSNGVTQAATSQEFEAHNFPVENKRTALLSDYKEQSKLNVDNHPLFAKRIRKHRRHPDAHIDAGDMEDKQSSRSSPCSERDLSVDEKNPDPVRVQSRTGHRTSEVRKHHKHDESHFRQSGKDHNDNNVPKNSGKDASRHFRHNKNHDKRSRQRSSVYLPTNRYRSNQASHLPNKFFQENCQHPTAVNPCFQTQVSQAGACVHNNGFSSNPVTASPAAYNSGKYWNDGTTMITRTAERGLMEQRRSMGQKLGPSEQYAIPSAQYESRAQNYDSNQICSAVGQYPWKSHDQSYNTFYSAKNQGDSHIYNRAYHEPHAQNYVSNQIGSTVGHNLWQSHQQMHNPFYSTQNQGDNHIYNHDYNGPHAQNYVSNQIGSTVGQNPWQSHEQMHNTFHSAQNQGDSHRYNQAHWFVQQPMRSQRQRR